MNILCSISIFFLIIQLKTDDSFLTLYIRKLDHQVLTTRLKMAARKMRDDIKLELFKHSSSQQNQSPLRVMMQGSEAGSAVSAYLL